MFIQVALLWPVMWLAVSAYNVNYYTPAFLIYMNKNIPFEKFTIFFLLAGIFICLKKIDDSVFGFQLQLLINFNTNLV